MHIEGFAAAPVNKFLHGFSCIPAIPVIIRHENTIHLKTIRMPPAPGNRGKLSFNKYPKDPVGIRICCLLVILCPDLFCQPELRFR